MSTTNLYATFDESTGLVTISAYSIDSIEWENNHMPIQLLHHNGNVNKHESVMNIIRNIFNQVNLVVVWE